MSDLKRKFLRQARLLLKDPIVLIRVLDLAQKRSRLIDQHLRGVGKDFKTMIRLVKAWIGGRYRQVRWSTVLVSLGTILYFLDPIDLIPDFIPLIGYSDDLALILFALKRVRGELEKFEDWEQEVTVEAYDVD